MTELFELLQREYEVAIPWAQATALTFLRIGAAMAVLPGLAEQNIPARLRLALALLLTLGVLPATAPIVPSDDLITAFLPEIFIGLVIGLALRFFIFALSTAGTIIANSTSLSQLFANGAEAQPAISQLLTLAGLTIAFQTGFLTKVIAFLILSYDVFPAGLWPNAGVIAEWGSGLADMAFALGLKLALPFAVASLLYNLALGIINRAMPQLMVTFIGAPALSLGGIFLMALAFPTMLSVWLTALNAFLGANGGL